MVLKYSKESFNLLLFFIIVANFAAAIDVRHSQTPAYG